MVEGRQRRVHLVAPQASEDGVARHQVRPGHGREEEVEGKLPSQRRPRPGGQRPDPASPRLTRLRRLRRPQHVQHEEKGGQRHRRLLAAETHGVERPHREGAHGAGPAGSARPAGVQPARRHHGQGRVHLRPPHHVRHRLHVHRVDGEQRGARPRAPGGGLGGHPPRPRPCAPEELEQQEAHQDGDGHVGQHAHQVEAPGPALEEGPLPDEAQEGEGPVVQVLLPGPVRPREGLPRPGLGHHRVLHHDDLIVVGEAVGEGRRVGRPGQERGHQERQRAEPRAEAPSPGRSVHRRAGLALRPSPSPPGGSGALGGAMASARPATPHGDTAGGS